MSYEFAEDDPLEEIPTTPDYWHLKAERIYQILPFDPIFVKHFSVIEDPKTRQLGIDTNDTLPDEASLDFCEGTSPIGLMRIVSADDSMKGYLVDLRYARQLLSRPLDFDYTVYKDEDPNELHKTVPALGAIFHDPEIERLRLRSKHRDALKGFAAGLMKFVDAERARRGASVWVHTIPSEPPKITPAPALDIHFSAQSPEATPESE